MAALADEIRDRLTLRNAAVAVGVAALYSVVLDAPPMQVAATLATTALVGLGDVVAEAYDEQEAEQLAIGVGALLGAGLLGRFGDGHPSVPAGVGLIGGWLTVDAVQQLRHGPPGEEPSPAADGTAVYRQYVAGRIQDVLDERPHTRLELRDALDADAGAVDAALDLLESRGAVERDGTVYERSTPEPPGVARRIHDWLGRAGRRLARPLTVAFASRRDDVDAERDRGVAGVSPDAANAAGASPDTTDAAAGSPDGDRSGTERLRNADGDEGG